MNVQDYIAANAKYLGERVSANLCQVPDAAWPGVVAALKELQGEAASDPGIDCDVVITNETLADFDDTRAQWREKGDRDEIDCAGFKAVFFDGFQRFKGKPRERCIVLDVGEKRVVLL